MTSSEIKKKLISRINQSEDNVLLKSLYTLMVDESQKKPLALSEEQLASATLKKKSLREYF